MNIDQITNELKNISDKINLIDSNIKFNIQVFWSVLALIVAVLSKLANRRILRNKHIRRMIYER